MLRWRLLSAAVIIAVLLLFFYLDVRQPLLDTPGLWLVPLVALLAVAATGELLDMLRDQVARPAAWATHAGALLVALSACAPMLWTMRGLSYPANCPIGRTGWPLAALGISLLLVAVAEMYRYRAPGRSTVQLALGVLTVAYVGLSLAFIVLLRTHGDSRLGMVALLSLVVIVKMSDTGAYFTGRMLGRHKMVPTLSPGKTWEGTIGGLLTACLVSWLYFEFAVSWLTGAESAAGWGWLPFALVVAVSGVLGDLAESMIKRDMGRKDSSRWLPGLGGVLDVLDSLFLAAPAAWIFWAGGLVGPAVAK